MPTFPFMQSDAFTRQPLSGNSCAIVFDADDLDSETMLAIAREMNLSETAFVMRSQVADFHARYFTPSEEIPLAGHPTIATVFAMFETERLKPSGDVTTISLELRDGPIRVDVHMKDSHVERVVMSQRKPQFLSVHSPADAMPAFGLTEDDVVSGCAIQTVSTGTPQLMVLVRNLDALHRAKLDILKYDALRARSDFFSASVLPARSYECQSHVCATLCCAAGLDRRSIHRLGHRRHGGVSVALRLD